ncbi:head-tail connector protein [Phaeobacter inhibens]|uniref:head-tail connector protein n=1 Tax=Phaeobacter inhibens TaxID=221822 RepID=UPI0021A7F7DA|nr:head-tail connector protein [Phaeobacter inhibens]UWR99224.1 head-tail connector protein [Phaeobacter inhibens]
MVTLEEAKAYCRVTPEETEFDGEIQIALDAAVDHLRSINVDVAADPFPPALKQAVLMLVAHFFENKEAVTPEKVWFTPIGVDRLIAPYRGVSL